MEDGQSGLWLTLREIRAMLRQPTKFGFICPVGEQAAVRDSQDSDVLCSAAHEGADGAANFNDDQKLPNRESQPEKQIDPASHRKQAYGPKVAAQKN